MPLNLLRKFFSLSIFLCAAAPAWSAEGAEHGSPILDLIFKIINFVVLVGLLYYFARKPVSLGLTASAELAKRQLDEARSAKSQAEKEIEQFRVKIAALKQEAESMRAKAKEDAEKERANIIKEAAMQAQFIQEQARFTIEQEYKKAELSLKQWVSLEAVNLANKQIQEQMSAKKQESLVQEYLKQL